MRSFKPNSRGIIVPQNQPIKTGGHVHAYKKASTALPRVDRLRAGEKPRIAITRKQGGIGDVLMTTPTVKAIAKKYDIKITYGTDFDYLDGALPKVLYKNPYIDNIVTWRAVKPEEFDAVIDLTCPCVVHEQPHCQPVNRIDLFARHARIPLDDPSMDLILEHEEIVEAKQYLIDNNLDLYPFILVQPSSSTLHRDAPVEIMQKAIFQFIEKKPNYRVIVLTHDSDNKSNNWKFHKIHIAHNLKVREIAALMTFADLVFCPDSAILHLASALKKKCVTLFGPTDPRARVNYHPEAVAVWPGKELRNYPCWYQNPGDGYLCWKRLEVPIVRDLMLALINGNVLPQSRDLVHFGNYHQSNQFYETL